MHAFEQLLWKYTTSSFTASILCLARSKLYILKKGLKLKLAHVAKLDCEQCFQDIYVYVAILVWSWFSMDTYYRIITIYCRIFWYMLAVNTLGTIMWFQLQINVPEFSLAENVDHFWKRGFTVQEALRSFKHCWKSNSFIMSTELKAHHQRDVSFCSTSV